MGGADVNRPWAADDFATIRARMEELRREREGAQAAESDLQQDAPTHRARTLTLAARRDGRGAGSPIRFRPQLGRQRLWWCRREQPADQFSSRAEAQRLDTA